MNEKSLENIGLTKGEANVYLTLLKLGSTSTGALIKESKVSRSKVYDVLERLKQKGLATEVTKENVRYFEAADPKRILDYLQKKKQDIENTITNSEKLVKNLNKLRSKELEKQETKAYTGIEGLKTVYNEILHELKEGEEYLAFGIGKKEIENNRIALFLKKFHQKRAEKKIKARIIMSPETRKEMKEFNQLKNYQAKYSDNKFPTNIAIWKNKVLTLVWDHKPVAFVIESKQVSDRYRRHFEHLWKTAKKS